MARLPLPGGDNGNWGSILNDYLSQAHKVDGSLKDDIVTASAIADGSITETLLATAVQTKLNSVGAANWDTLSNKPAVIAAGADQAAARAAIGIDGEYVTGAVYPTIASLRSATTSSTGFVRVSGYYAASDSGGGIFRWDSSDTSSADNGGTIITPSGGLASSGRWKRVTGSEGSSVFYAAQFGIIADGTTNVSTALGTLINTLPSGSILHLEGAAYYVPTFRLSYTNDISIVGVPTKTRLLGDGSQTVANYGTDVMFNMQADSALKLRGITFDNAGVAIGFKDLMELGDIDLIDCHFFESCGVAVAIYDPAALTARTSGGYQMSFGHFRMRGCKVTDCEVGLYLPTSGGWESFVVSDCTFDGVGMSGVLIGWDYSTTRERAIFQVLQSPISVHDNVFKNIHYPSYTMSNPGANAICTLGQSVSVHDNYIENVTNDVVFDDCEAIYTKARYVDIHDNVLVNAGGYEGGIIVKGVGYEASTTLASSMNGLTLPQGTIEVASTEGFSPPLASISGVLIQTSAGWKAVTYTGMTATSFTGVSGGSGTMSTGGAVRGDVSYLGDTQNMTGISQPSKIHDNIIIYTRNDQTQRGVVAYVRNIEITRNLIVGATGAAIMGYNGGLIEGNIIRDHHGSYCIATVGTISGEGYIIRNNMILNYDGAYVPGATSLLAIWVTAQSGVTLRDVLVEGNVIRNNLTAAGVRSTASTKLRAVQVHASTTSALYDVSIRNNHARNVNIGINVVVDGPVTGLANFFNDWSNEDGGAAPIVSTSHATSVVNDGNAISTTNTATLSNKTIALGSNTISGTTAQFNAALSDGDFVTLGGVETLVNKTLTTPKISTMVDANGAGTLTMATTASAVNYIQVLNSVTGAAVRLRAIGTDTNISFNIVSVGTGTVQANGVEIANISGAQTLTNKTIALGSNTISGTTAQFNAALTDGDFVTLAGVETLTNKTLTTPRISTILDSNGAGSLNIATTASAVNYIQVINSAAGAAVRLRATGTDTNIPFNIVSAGTGTVQANGVEIANISGAQTLTNKRVTKRIGTVASSATPTINTDSVDQFNITALAADITSMTTGLTGTPTDGQELCIRFKDDGTPRAITWGASFAGNLLATTVANQTHIQQLVYDSVAVKWVGAYMDPAGY